MTADLRLPLQSPRADTESQLADAAHVDVWRPAGGPRKTANRRVGALQRFERELLEWVVAWAPYGGAPEEETFPEFGLSASEVTGRVAHLVCQLLSGELPALGADRVLAARAWMALRPVGTPAHSRLARAAMHANAMEALTAESRTGPTPPHRRRKTQPRLPTTELLAPRSRFD